MLRGLIRACHPGPTAVVTGIVTALAWRLGWSDLPLMGIAVAVLLGQLSVGWSNDAHDARDDAAAQRADKPTVTGEVTAATLWRGAAVAGVIACAPSWTVAGPIGGTFHVIGIGAGWSYNLVASRTAWAWLPYAIAFPLLPAFLTVGLGDGLPPLWLPVVFGLLGVAAHLANSVRDLEADEAVGLDGTARRLGARGTLLLTVALLGLGSIVLAAVLWQARPGAAAVALVAFLAVALGAMRGDQRLVFRLVLALAVVDAALVLVAA